MKFLKTLSIIFVYCFLSQKSYSEIDVEAEHFILQDHLSGEVRFEKDADSSIYPASMTK